MPRHAGRSPVCLYPLSVLTRSGTAGRVLDSAGRSFLAITVPPPSYPDCPTRCPAPLLSDTPLLLRGRWVQLAVSLQCPPPRPQAFLLPSWLPSGPEQCVESG